MRPMRFLGNAGNSNARHNRPVQRSQSSTPLRQPTLNLEQRHQYIRGNPAFSDTYKKMKQDIHLDLSHPKVKEQKPIDPKSIEEALQRSESNFKHSTY
jgi:hypothetical protein